ncbi:MAG: lipid-A-disaccharide synthase [Bacteroidales bacterium]|nr:lipid-A-disaccharide synthase [Bacteroidales bacterium]
MKYYIIAGEASGDLHASNLMRGLLNSDPAAEFRFWGGDEMAAVGGTLVRHYKEGAVMGIVEVLLKARLLKANLRHCKSDILQWQPDVVILVDYPGFNFKIAKFASQRGLKVFYYIAPKVWASREGRIRKLKKYVSRLFVIFPFEVDYFRKHGIEPFYAGNPLLDSIARNPAVEESKEAFCRRTGLDDRPIVALLAGSRAGEIKFLMPHFLELERIIKESGGPLSDCQLVIAGAPSVSKDIYEKYLAGSDIKVVFGETYPLLRHAVSAAVNSGTASLEAALIGTPQVVCYGMNPITFAIAIRLLKVKYISLANLILDKLIFKELLQKDCTAPAILKELEAISADGASRQAMVEDYRRLREVLGGEGASERVAQEMVSELKSR